MLVDELTTYESWDLEKPVIPPHSRLYHLEPIGLGTPYVESLTGYIARLAEAHCVLPGVLMNRELTPIVKEFSRRGLESELKPDRAGIFSRTGTLNGIGVMAMDWVRAIETLTLRHDLRFLTMLTWSEVLPSRGLLRTKWAYCPTCYQEWRSSEQVIYEPLLWALDVVTVCLRHQRHLRLQCLHCSEPLRPLAWNSRPGHCPKCGGWLGIPSDIERTCSEAVTEEEWQWQTWMINAIGELLAAAPRLPSLPTRERIAKVFSACIGEVSKGNIAAFAHLLGKPKNTVWMWHAGKVLPSLDVLTRICYCLKMSVLNFLTPEVVAIGNGKIINLPQSQQEGTSRKPCKLLNLKKMRQALLSVLECDESPPPSMKEVAKRLEYDVERLRRHFPDLCRAISARYINGKRARYNKRIEQLSLEVRRIAFELDAQGVYPSNTHVSLHLTQPGFIRNKDVRAALHQVRRELGWEK